MVGRTISHYRITEQVVARWEQYKKDNGVLDISYDLSGAN